jgi:glycosyltransferase involved in cell wall biosynthesis
LLLGVAARNVARKHGLPVVFTYHTMYEEYAHYIPLPRALVRWMIVRLVKKFCQSVDAIMVGSSAVANLLRERGVTTPIDIIPSPLQTDFIVDEVKALQPRVSSDRWTLVTVGRMVPEKNMRATIDLYASLPRDRFRLVLVGFGADYDALQKYAYDEFALSHDDVQFVHKPPRAEIVTWYRKADLFVFTSQTDTQGLVLAESLAAGTPVIALHGPGQDSSVVDGVNGFLCDTVSVMRDKILWLHEHADAYATMRDKAYAASLTYRSSAVVAKVVAVYERVKKQGRLC